MPILSRSAMSAVYGFDSSGAAAGAACRWATRCWQSGMAGIAAEKWPTSIRISKSRRFMGGGVWNTIVCRAFYPERQCSLLILYDAIHFACKMGIIRENSGFGFFGRVLLRCENVNLSVFLSFSVKLFSA